MLQLPLSRHMLRKKPGLTHCFTFSTVLTARPSLPSPALCSPAEMARAGQGTAGPPHTHMPSNGYDMEDCEAQGGRKTLHCFTCSPALLRALLSSSLEKSINRNILSLVKQREQPAVAALPGGRLLSIDSPHPPHSAPCVCPRSVLSCTIK